MNSIPLLATLALDSLGVTYKEKDCVVCHRKFLQRMKINDQGKPVRMKGESDKFCSDECRREYNRAYHRKLRADNAEHFRQYNRKRMITQRNEQYKERVEPFYNKLKSLILSEEDDAALELLTDISLGRVPLKKVK